MPLAELRAACDTNAEADGEDGLKVLVLNLARYFAASFQSNYSEFPDSCLSVRFRLSENIYQMLVNRTHIFLKQFRNQRLVS